MKKNSGLRRAILIAFLFVITVLAVGVSYISYQNSDLKRQKVFSSHAFFFTSLSNVSDSSYLIKEQYYNQRNRLDSISNILGMHIASIDYDISENAMSIYVRTEPYFDYSGYFYSSNDSLLDCMLNTTERLLTDVGRLKLSVVRLSKNWITYRKNKKDIPIDVLYLNNIPDLTERCK